MKTLGSGALSFLLTFFLWANKEKMKILVFTHPTTSWSPLSRGDFAMFIFLIYFLLTSILKSSTSLNSSLLVQNPANLILIFFHKSSFSFFILITPYYLLITSSYLLSLVSSCLGGLYFYFIIACQLLGDSPIKNRDFAPLNFFNFLPQE